MFYKTKISTHIRVAPEKLVDDIKEGIFEEIKETYLGYISKDLGIVIDIADVEVIGEGVIVPGDAGVFYETQFSVFTFKPELQEIANVKVRDIADFGVFVDLGPIDGMIHISQTMDDFVTFSKDKVLLGKETKRSLKVGDLCKARIIAVSFKDITNPKIGLTMRQPALGKPEWIEEDNKKKKEKTKAKAQ